MTKRHYMAISFRHSSGQYGFVMPYDVDPDDIPFDSNPFRDLSLGFRGPPLQSKISILYDGLDKYQAKRRISGLGKIDDLVTKLNESEINMVFRIVAEEFLHPLAKK